MYIAPGYTKIWQENKFNVGYVGKTKHMDSKTVFVNDSARELLLELADFCRTTERNATYEFDGTIGRVDFSVHENDNGTLPTDEEMKLWKEGKFRLWLADYTFMVYKAEPVMHLRALAFK